MEDGSQQSQQQSSGGIQAVNSEQQVSGPTTGQPQQQETPQEPLTSSNAGEEAAGHQSASVAKEPDDVSSETPPAASTANTVVTPSTTAEIIREPTGADKLNERDNVTETPSPAVTGTPANGVHKLSAHEMDLAELKVKITCHEKNNMALKMELKCAELQVAAKEKLDAKKTRLIELLDAKLAAVEKKNVRLIEMMEQMVRDKDTHSHRLIDATKNMEELSKRLAESERVRQELRKVNRELKTMLENVEDKGTQIAKLAKEKVLKYKEENERMQRELDDLKGGGGDGDAASTADGSDASPSPGAVDSSKDSSASEVAGFADAVNKTETLYRQLEAAVLGRDWQQEPIDGLRAAIGEATRISGDLRSAVDQLRRSQSAASNFAASTVDEDRARSERAFNEEIRAKSSEIASLKDELARLKTAIGQLVGLGLNAAPPTAPAAVAQSVAPSSE